MEIQEAEIEVQMAAAQSSKGSQRSAGRSQDLGNLAPVILESSPEPLKSKMERMNEYAVSALPAVPEMPGAEQSASADNNPSPFALA